NGRLARRRRTVAELSVLVVAPAIRGARGGDAARVIAARAERSEGEVGGDGGRHAPLETSPRHDRSVLVFRPGVSPAVGPAFGGERAGERGAGAHAGESERGGDGCRGGS